MGRPRYTPGSAPKRRISTEIDHALFTRFEREIANTDMTLRAALELCIAEWLYTRAELKGGDDFGPSTTPKAV